MFSADRLNRGNTSRKPPLNFRIPTDRINWTTSSFLIGTFVLTLTAVPLYLWYFGIDWFQLALFALLLVATAFSITLGYHRLFSHATFRAKLPVRLFTLISRFTAFGKLIGIDPSVPDAAQKRIALFRSSFSKLVDSDLELPAVPRGRVAALVLTWWDVSLQLLIGLLMLFRLRVTDKFAHVLLLLFIFTTYLPAPVFGFGWILAIMGLTLAKENFPSMAAAYMISFVAIIFYQLPWRDWVVAT